MNKLDRVLKGVGRRMLGIPVEARHAEHSMIFSADDEIGRPSHRLLDVSIDAIRLARAVDLADISVRIPAPPRYSEIWPGEHYALLAGLVSVVRPRSVVEIGTGAGLGTLTIKKFLPAEATVHTFDIISWRRFQGTLLREEDFADGRLIQSCDNWADADIGRRHQSLLESADMIFLDAAKDGRLEDHVLNIFDDVSFKQPPLLVMDDIRVWNMLATWRSIRRPKLDLTSFGHWSGTGLVDWV